jgi:hypothetical protein
MRRVRQRRALSAIAGIGGLVVPLLAGAAPAQAQPAAPASSAPADPDPAAAPAAPLESDAPSAPPSPLAQLLPGIAPVEVPTPSSNPEEVEGPRGVLERKRPEIEPLGFQTPLGLLTPSATGSAVFDSNIFATQTHPASDLVFHLHPEINLDSGEGLVQYLVGGYAELVQYATHDSLSNGNVGASAGVTYSPTPEFNVQSQTAARYAHQDPASFSVSVPNGVVNKLPVYSVLTETLSATRDVQRLGVSLTGGFQREDYSNITISGVAFNQSALDADAFSIGPKVSYAITPLTRAFVQTQYLRRDYDVPLRNSNTYTVTAGSDFEVTRLIKGSVFAGYNIRQYDSATIGTISSPAYGINVAWFPTELMTVLFSGKQDFSDTTVTGPTGTPAIIDIKTFKAEVDYEVLRELIVTASGSFESDNFSGASRTDNTISAGAVATYALDRNMSLYSQYKYTNRMSSLAGFSYDRHQVGVGLRVQY